MNWWIIPAFFYVIHGLAVLMFGLSNAPMTGPDVDAGSMIWIAWMIIDFPIGFAAVLIGEDASSNAAGITIVAIVGGIQWIIWGLALTGIIRWFQSP